MDKKYVKLGNPLGDYSKELKKHMDERIKIEDQYDKEHIGERILLPCPNHRSQCRASTTTRLYIRCVKMVKPGELYCFWHKSKQSSQA